MTPALLNLAIEYGWGCKTCGGMGQTRCEKCDRPWSECLATDLPDTTCPDCHGNRITPEDAEEFERRVVETLDSFEEHCKARGDQRGAGIGDNLQRSEQSLDSLQRKGNQP